MKNLKNWYWTCGGFAGVGAILYLIVIGEYLFNTASSPAWINTLKIIGLVGFCIALLILVIMVVTVAIKERKENKKGQVKLSDEEILAKYKSARNKK